MPELPEVETIRMGLEKYVVGREILDIEILHPKPFQGEKEKVLGSKIVFVRRSGKGLILDLDNGYSLAIHIKMTGQLVFRDPQTADIPVSSKVGSLPNKHTHVIFKLICHPELASGSKKMPKQARHDKSEEAFLYYNDMRRFGWIRALPTGEVASLPFFKQMGPEPLKDLTFEKFKNLILRSTTKIKILIMDQAKIGGIGNIYANDALFEARIDPRRAAKSLTSFEAESLFNAINKVLKKGIEAGGSSERSYVNILGQEGKYQNHTLVYGKKGMSCSREDGGIIQRISIGGRGTFFCPVCQK